MIELIGIGGSAGSLSALEVLAHNLHTKILPPMVIVIHINNETEQNLTAYFERLFNFSIVEIKDSVQLQANTIFVAPSGYHVLVENDQTLSLCVSEKVTYARPSIDVFFESAASVFKDKFIAVLLSGANKDGKNGTLSAKTHGSRIFVQDPDTAEARTMPKSAILSKGADYIVTMPELAQYLNEMVLYDANN